MKQVVENNRRVGRQWARPPFCRCGTCCLHPSHLHTWVHTLAGLCTCCRRLADDNFGTSFKVNNRGQQPEAYIILRVSILSCSGTHACGIHVVAKCTRWAPKLPADDGICTFHHHVVLCRWSTPTSPSRPACCGRRWCGATTPRSWTSAAPSS